MKVHLPKFTRRLLLLMPVIVLFSANPITTPTNAQTRKPESSGTLTADQQKQLDRLQQLNEQMQRDRDAARSAVSQYGGDSDEADSAQQRLLQDRQEYRSLRRSLQQAGVSVPPDATTAGTNNQSRQSGHCGHHANGHHDCYGDDGHCANHDNDCCCGGHGK